MTSEHYPALCLSTERTIIRKYVPEDIHVILHLLKRNCERLKDHFPHTISMVTDENTALDFIFLRTTEWDQIISFTYGIFTKDTNTYIGQITIKKIEWDKKEAELGYFIDAQFEGQGIMSEVMEEIELQCLKLGFDKLYLRIIPYNIRSIKLADKFNYKFIQTLKENIKNPSGGMNDILLYMKSL